MEWTPTEIGEFVGTYGLGAFLVVGSFLLIVWFIRSPPKWFESYMDRRAAAHEREAVAQETIADCTKAIREASQQSLEKIDHIAIKVDKHDTWFEQWGTLAQEMVRHYFQAKHNEPHPKAGESES